MPLKDIKPYDFAWMTQKVHLAIPNQDEMALSQSQIISATKKKQRALLMLHGFSSSAAVFRLMAPKLKHYDHIFMPTLAGHGKSIASFAKARATDWLRDAENAYKALNEQFEYVDILGLSLGGLIACHMIHKYPIRNLFLLAPALALSINLPRLRQIALFCKHLGFKNVMNRGGSTFVPFADELLYRQLPLSVIIELLNFIESYQFKSWDASTYLFLGEHDNVVNSKKVHEILKPLPSLEVTYLENSNHVLPLDGDYEKVIQQINLYSSK